MSFVFSFLSPSDFFLVRNVMICNERGLHARASAKFVKLVEKHEARVVVEKDGVSVSGSSIVGLMMLAASLGCTIVIKASGIQAVSVLDALEQLVSNRFGEET